jgi:hypothetical protein
VCRSWLVATQRRCEVLSWPALTVWAVYVGSWVSRSTVWWTVTFSGSGGHRRLAVFPVVATQFSSVPTGVWLGSGSWPLVVWSSRTARLLAGACSSLGAGAAAVGPPRCVSARVSVRASSRRPCWTFQEYPGRLGVPRLRAWVARAVRLVERGCCEDPLLFGLRGVRCCPAGERKPRLSGAFLYRGDRTRTCNPRFWSRAHRGSRLLIALGCADLRHDTACYVCRCECGCCPALPNPRSYA